MAVGTAAYPASLDDVHALIQAANGARSTLSAQLTVGATTASLASAASFATSGTFTVEGEIIYYSGKSGDDLTGLLRGRESTTDATHPSGALVNGAITARHHNVLADALVAIEAELGTTPSGIASTVKAKLDGLMVNVVSDYGAAGGTDSTTAIQNAIDAVAAAGGGIVYVPPASSSYRVSLLEMKTSVWLRGEGIGSQLRSVDSNSNPYMIIMDANTVREVFISDIYLSCTKSQQTNNGCILFDQTGSSGDSYHRFWNIKIAGFKNDGIRVAGPGRGMYFNNLLVNSCDGHAFVFENGSTDHAVVSCQCFINGLNGFHIEADNTRMVACKAGNHGQIDSTDFGDGFYFGSTVECCTLVGCEAQANYRHGVFLDGADECEISAMLWNGNHANALRLSAADENKISGTVAVGSGAGDQDPSTRIVELVGTNTLNDIDIHYSSGALTGATAPVNGTATNNSIKVSQSGPQASGAVTFAASYTPDPYLYSTVTMTLTNNITINAPTYQHRGQRLRFVFTQDGTGTRTHTFNSVFKTNWTPNTTANRINEIEFECDGTNWIQTGANVNLQ